MPNRFAPKEIENPQAYEAAKMARIRMNANTTRRRTLEAQLKADGDSQEFCDWLFCRTPESLLALYVASQKEFDQTCEEFGPAGAAYQKAMKDYHARVGSRPDFIRDALNGWGGLSVKQLDVARKAYARNIERAEGRVQQEAARLATALPWLDGRQDVTGVVQTVKLVDNGFGGAWKCLILTEDGRKLWTTVPQRLVDVSRGSEPGDYFDADLLKGQTVTIKVTVEPSKDDATMGFGKRPK